MKNHEVMREPHLMSLSRMGLRRAGYLFNRAFPKEVERNVKKNIMTHIRSSPNRFDHYL